MYKQGDQFVVTIDAVVEKRSGEKLYLIEDLDVLVDKKSLEKLSPYKQEKRPSEKVYPAKFINIARMAYCTCAEPKYIQIGDRVGIDLQDGRMFTATAYNVTEEKVFFIFDELVAKRPMNKDGRTEGGFEKSDLCKWLNSEFKELLPDWINNMRTDDGIFLLSLQEMFGLDDNFDECGGQLEFFKDPKNRVCALQGDDLEWYYLRDVVSAAFFAGVYGDGRCYYTDASHSDGVRPAFAIKRS